MIESLLARGLPAFVAAGMASPELGRQSQRDARMNLRKRLARNYAMAIVVILMLACSYAQISLAETVTSNKNGYSLTVPEGWELFPKDILRLREQFAEQTLKTKIEYDFGFQAPGKDRWQAPPYAYVMVSSYANLGLEREPSPSVLEKLIRETYSPENLAGMVDVLKDGLNLNSTDSLGSEIDSHFKGLTIKYDDEKKRVLQHTKAGDFGAGPLDSWSMAYYGRFAVVQIDFFSPAATARDLAKTRENLFDSFRFLKGFGWPEEGSKGDMRNRERVVPEAAQDFQYRWPKAFLKKGCEKAPPDVDGRTFFPDKGKTSPEDIMSAYSYYQGQKFSVKSVREQQPSLSASLDLAQARFEARFSPAIKQIEAYYEHVDLAAFVKEQIEECRSSFTDRVYGPEDAKDAIEDIKNRASGEIPSPILETLLIFHPLYQKHPELEFDHEFKREYLSEGDEKARGLKIAMQIPCSWSSDAGRRPHVLRRFRNIHGQGKAIITMTVNPFPEHVRPEEFDTVGAWDYAALLVRGLSNTLDADLELVDAGRIRLAGQPGTWMEAMGSLNQNGLPLPIRMVNFTLRYEDNLIAIQCMVSPQLEGEDVEEAYRRVAPLFMRILRTFDIYNRWDS